MILQFSKTRPWEYHAKYSPLTTLFLTHTFSLCQKASFVSSTQFSKYASFKYWNEYFPVNSTFSNRTFSARIMKYSLIAFASFTWIFLDIQPNSLELIWQSLMTISLHSLNALIPCIFVFSISIWSPYHKAARQFSVNSHSLIFKPWSCQNG